MPQVEPTQLEEYHRRVVDTLEAYLNPSMTWGDYLLVSLLMILSATVGWIVGSG